MDKQVKKHAGTRDDGAASEAGSDAGSNPDSDHDEKVRLLAFFG